MFQPRTDIRRDITQLCPPTNSHKKRFIAKEMRTLSSDYQKKETRCFSSSYRLGKRQLAGTSETIPYSSPFFKLKILPRAYYRDWKRPKTKVFLADANRARRYQKIHANDGSPSRADHFKPVTGTGVLVATHASDGAELVRIDPEIIHDRGGDVKADYFAYDQAGASGACAHLQDLHQLA